MLVLQLFSWEITLSVRTILCYSFICESCPSSLVLSSCFPSSSSCSVWVSLWFDLLPFLVHVLRFIRSQEWSLEIQEWKKWHSYQCDRSGGWTKESPLIASFLTREEKRSDNNTVHSSFCFWQYSMISSIFLFVSASQSSGKYGEEFKGHTWY